MSLPNYLTLAHLRKVIAALGQRFTRIENDLERVDTIIENKITQSDWDQNETYEIDYVKNKPAVKAGDGENSVLIGQIEQDEDAKEYHLTFDYPTTTTDTVTFTTEDDLSEITWNTTAIKNSICHMTYDITINSTGTVRHQDIWRTIVSIDISNNTITFAQDLIYLDVYTFSSVNATIFYKYKIASGSFATVEGKITAATTSYTHVEGYGTRAFGLRSHAEGFYSAATGSSTHAEGSSVLASGTSSHAEGYGTTSSGTYSHAEGNNTVSSGGYSHAEGNNTIASYAASHAEGYGTTSSNANTHAEGFFTTASGDTSHAEGIIGTASGLASHVEGGYLNHNIVLTGDANSLTYTVTSDILVSYQTGFIGAFISTSAGIPVSTPRIVSITLDANNILTSITLDKTLSTSAISNKTYQICMPNKAVGNASHAEGSATLAIGYRSHAEGANTFAVGYASHTEGVDTVASGDFSHASGYGAIANHQSQYVFGEYNIADPSTAAASERGNYVEIVGNGTGPSAQSNARTLDWSGNEVLAGKLTVGAAPTNEMDVATKAYVDSSTSGITTNLAGLTDTTVSSPTNGQVLTYDSTSSKWINADPTGTAYSLSLSGSTITLTGSDGSTSSINLPIYDGSVTEVWQGGVY